MILTFCYADHNISLALRQHVLVRAATLQPAFAEAWPRLRHGHEAPHSFGEPPGPRQDRTMRYERGAPAAERLIASRWYAALIREWTAMERPSLQVAVGVSSDN